VPKTKRGAKQRERIKPISAKTRAEDVLLRELLRNVDMGAFGGILARLIKLPS